MDVDALYLYFATNFYSMRQALLLLSAITLCSCSHYHYTATNLQYPAVPVSRVTIDIEGSAVPAAGERVGIIEYKTHNKGKAIRKLQRLAARNGATAIYQPAKGGLRRPGLPARGSFIAVRSAELSQAPAAAPAGASRPITYKEGDRIRWIHPKKPENTGTGTVIEVRRNDAYIVRFDGSGKKMRVYGVECSPIKN